ncbi:hypothetical protein BBJ28_00014846 [Nothophytophthora sp. Chile5]|nr:hypothetical protein BBJ28_00014846 [Nothophytophthora sp. Chile5]
MVSTSASKETDESEYEDSDSDSEEDDVGKVTTMARSNKKHHYALVCCQRSLMGHTRRERIELDDPQEPVELSWGEDGLLSTRFEFSLVHGSAGPTGRRRTLTCRARDAKEYLQWTGALRMAVERHGKYIGEKKHKYNRSTHARTLASSKAPSQHRGSMGSFFDLNVVEEQQLQLERDAACSPTSPTAATAAEAIAPPEPDVAKESALKPVSVEIAGSTYIVPTSSTRRPMSVVVQPTARPMGTRLQRRKRSVSSSGAAGVARLRRGSITYMVTPTAPSGLNDSRSQSTATKVEETRPYNPLVQVTRPRPTHPRRRRGSSAARPLVSTPPASRPRKISLSTGALVLSPRKDSWIPHTPDTDSSSRRRRLRVPSSPLPILGAMPMLQASSSVVDSAVDFIDAYERPSTDFPRTTELVNSLVRIAGVSSAQQRQQLLQRQRQESQPGQNAYGLHLIPRESEVEDPWLLSRRSSKLNFDACDIEEPKSTLSRRQRLQIEMKVAIYVASRGDGGASACRVCWYAGTSDAQVALAVRMQLRLPRDEPFLLRDADGDVVPVSSALPPDRHYTLLLQQDLALPPPTANEERNANTTTSSMTRTPAQINGDVCSHLVIGATRKRRKLSGTATVAHCVPPQLAAAAGGNGASGGASTRRAGVSTPLRVRSIASLVTQFVDAFTRPIANDDNVSFIPNTGRFALYALYGALVPDTRCHPKGQDVFYKMTSMHGKVDRQRVIRYYRCPVRSSDRNSDRNSDSGQETQVVQCKPQGKGPFLRRYRDVDSDEALQEVEKAAAFVAELDLDPKLVMARYERFVHGFTPISKSEYQAQSV